uniref:Uncharacterized protein n=1 Tax=Arundo donax TaxID=35708 RepID=A0A0A8Z416_ARUDO
MLSPDAWSISPNYNLGHANRVQLLFTIPVVIIFDQNSMNYHFCD